MGAAAKAPRSLKARALQLLAQRDQSRVELRRKLLVFARAEALSRAAAGTSAQRRPDEADGAADGAAEHAANDAADPATQVEPLLDWLEAHCYLSPERFAEARVHARAARFGNRRIERELQLHQVQLSPGAAQALRETEFDRARAVWLRKFSAVAASAASRAKQGRFLIGRGFSADTVRRVLRSVGQTGADDPTEPRRAAADDEGLRS